MSRVPPTLSGKGARVWRGPIPGTHEPGFVEQPLVECELPLGVRDLIRGGRVLHAFTMGECNLLLGQEPGGIHGEMRWHLTISTPHRHPSWDEIKTARYRLLGPDTVMAMLLPPVADYVNVATQDHVFQLWEIEDAAHVWR
jgi:hypothetical protein